jgi:xanthine dehydrogenase/oxidase
MGQGLHTKIIQIAAKTLGTDVASIYVSETSTDKVANTSPTAASVQSDLNGMAVYNACLELAQRLAPLKAKKPDANLAQLAQMAIFERIDLTAHGFYATPDVGYDFNTSSGRPFHYFTYGAACSEVEIDTLTGEMSTLQADLVMDLGQSLNPAIDIGQIEGAYAQGFGLTCLEEVVVDDRYTRTPGKIFTRGPSTYKLPGFKDVPLKLNVHLLPNSQNPGVVYSSKGVGEPPLFLGASVFFAVKEAIQSARFVNVIWLRFQSTW